MTYTIIGAGIGGLTTALAFEQKGIDYQIFEQAPALNDVGAGIWLAPNALQVMEHLNVLEEVQSAGNSIDRITVGYPDLRPISDAPQDSMKREFGYSTVAIHRAKLQKLLFSKIPSEKIHLGKGFKQYEQLNSGKLSVTFSDDSTFETDYLIGADGIHSKVRKQLFPESKTRYSGQTCWRGIADIQLKDELKHRGFELWGDQVRFGISKVAEHKVYWFAVALAEPRQQDNIEAVRPNLLELFRNFHPLVQEILQSTPIDKILRNDINDLKPLDQWYANNICLIGDAGHATTPNMGQGGAQAIEDAYYLSNLIKCTAPKEVFEIFQNLRKRKVHSIVNQSWTTGKIAHWKYGTSLRNFIIKSMPKAILEKQLMKMYKIDQFAK